MNDVLISGFRADAKTVPHRSVKMKMPAKTLKPEKAAGCEIFAGPEGEKLLCGLRDETVASFAH